MEQAGMDIVLVGETVGMTDMVKVLGGVDL